MKIRVHPTPIRFLLLLVLFGGTVCNVQAQNLRTVRPQSVPEAARPPAPHVKPNAATAGKEVSLRKPGGVKLKGIVFFSKPSQINPSGISLAKGAKPPAHALAISAISVPVLRDPAFAKQLNRYFNAPLTLRTLGELKKTVIAWFRSHGYPFVAVVVPPQEVTRGIVQILVVDARLGKVVVQGNKWFSAGEYRSAIQIKPNQHINVQEVRQDVDWINRNPFRHAIAFIRPGKSFGQSNLVIRTNERRPVRGYLGADNYGTRISGRERYKLGFNLGNLFGRGQQLNYQFTHSMRKNLSWAHSAVYIIPLASRRILTFAAAYSKDSPDLPAPFNSEGRAWSVEAGYTIPWMARNGARKQISIRIPFKATNNNLEFSQTPITNNETNVIQLEVGYRYRQASSGRHQLGFNVDLVMSPGGLTNRNKSRYFNISRAGAKANYGILRAGMFFSRYLSKDFSWQTDINAQLATSNLLGSEQIAMSGIGAVRGYPDGLVYEDNGLIVRNDLFGPRFGSLRTDFFFDAGIGTNVDKLPGEQKSVFLSSVGLGLRYNFGSMVSASLVYGRELSAEPVQVPYKSGELYANLTIGF